MGRKSLKDKFGELSRQSRVKMHKSGKHWVRTIMTRVGFLRFKQSAEPEKILLTGDKHQKALTLLRGA